jgi:hypothetical protein
MENYALKGQISYSKVHDDNKIINEGGSCSHDFDAICPSCNKSSRYRNFFFELLSIDGIELNSIFGVPVLCTHCYQKMNISPIDLLDVQEKLLKLKDKIKDKIAFIYQNNIPVSFTPYIPKSIFEKLTNILGFDELLIHCFLDKNAIHDKRYDFLNYPILQRDFNIINQECKNDYFVILPSLNNKKIFNHLINECGINEERIIKLF